MIRRASLVTIVAAFAMIAAGCGGSSSDEGKIEDTITTYMSDVAQGDGEDACSQLSGDQERKFFSEIVEDIPELRATSCQDAVSKLAESLGASEKETLEGVQVEDVQIHGDEATASVKGGTRTAELTKEGDDWVISGGLSGG